MGRRTLLLIASILVAAAGTALVWLYVQSADERARATMRLVTVWEATRAIPPGSAASTLDATTVRARQVPALAVPQDRVTSLGGLRGQVTKQTVYPGQTLIAAQFGPPGSGDSIPAKHMGVSVRMDDPNRVAGLLQPGSHVAVYWLPTPAGGARGDGAGGGGPTVVSLVLADVPVIGVGAATSAAAAEGAAAKPDGTPTSPAVIILDAAHRDATSLMLAQATGTLYFTLLGPDATGAPSDRITLPELLKLNG